MARRHVPVGDLAAGAGPELRAAEIELCTEIMGRYADMDPPYGERLAALRRGDPVILADWEVSEFVPLGGRATGGRWFRLGSDDRVVEVTSG